MSNMSECLIEKKSQMFSTWFMELVRSDIHQLFLVHSLQMLATTHFADASPLINENLIMLSFKLHK